MPTSSHKFSDVPLLVSSPNGGGLILLWRGETFILDSRDHTGLAWRGGSYARGIISPMKSYLEWHQAADEFAYRALPDVNDIHDVLWHGNELYAVATGSNEILSVGSTGEIRQRMRFQGEGDAWHLNCLAAWHGRVVASAFGEFHTHRGYKGNTQSAGFVFDIYNGEKLWTGLSQPHSPLQDGDTLYVCDSETHRVLWRRGIEEGALQFEAYTRGLAVAERWLFVGLSQSRNTMQTGTTGLVAIIDRYGHQYVGTLPIPFSEVYAIVPVTTENWLLLLALIPSERDELRKQLHQCLQELQHAEVAAVALNRLQRHPMVGGLIKVLRWLKRDSSFGQVVD